MTEDKVTETKEGTGVDARGQRLAAARAEPVVMADVITGIHISNNIVRISLGQNEPDNSVAPCGIIALPLNQFGPFTKVLGNVVNDLVARVKKQQEAEEPQVEH